MQRIIISINKCGDGGWRVYFSDQSTNPPSRYRKRFQAQNEEEARSKAEAIVAELSGAWSVGDALDAYIEEARRRVSPETMRSYVGSARRLEALRDKTIDLIASEDIEAALCSMGERFEASTVKKARNVLGAACGLAVARGGAKSNPCVGVRPVDVPEAHCAPLDADGLRRLLGMMRGIYPCMIGLAMECGLTMGEIVELKPEDFSNGTVAPRRRASSCGSRAHTFEYGPEAIRRREMPAWLSDKIASLLDTEGYVFGGHTTSPNVEVTAKRVRGLLRAIGVQCPLSKLHRAATLSDAPNGDES